MKDWWYADHDGEVGPLSFDELVKTLSAYAVRQLDEVLVWREGFDNWKHVRDVAALAVLDLSAPGGPGHPSLTRTSSSQALGHAIRKSISIASIVLCVSALAALGGFWLYAFRDRPKCDSDDAISSIKEIAWQKLNDNRELLVGNRHPEYLTIDSFRKRSDLGETGTSCAARLVVHVTREYPRVDEVYLTVEYTIEPTTDGSVILSARFH